MVEEFLNKVTGKAFLFKEYMAGKIKNFVKEDDGMGVVEIVLIIIVLIGLAVIFKSQITSLVNSLLTKMTTQANKF